MPEKTFNALQTLGIVMMIASLVVAVVLGASQKDDLDKVSEELAEAREVNEHLQKYLDECREARHDCARNNCQAITTVCMELVERVEKMDCFGTRTNQPKE